VTQALADAYPVDPLRYGLPRGASSVVPAAAFAALALFGAVGCGHTARHQAAGRRPPAENRPTPVAALRSGPPKHIAVIVMENEEYGDVLGSRKAPYIDGLARRSALASQMYAVSHPSLPNYLALTGGSTFGIDWDCTDCRVPATGVVDQLEHAHISWKAYMEGIPAPCFTGGFSGEYAKKHDPFVYYTTIARDRPRCARVVPLTRLASDERRGALPRFIWITPNLCHDMHDCSVATGDRYLSGFLPGLLRALGPRGLLFLTWDEGSTDSGCCRLASGGHVLTIAAGGVARRGARMTSPADHYSVLQTIEDLFGLPRLRGAACGCTPSLRPLLVR
jgi:phosphatidylinositol-3-phosphatase